MSDQSLLDTASTEGVSPSLARLLGEVGLELPPIAVLVEEEVIVVVVIDHVVGQSTAEAEI